MGRGFFSTAGAAAFGAAVVPAGGFAAAAVVAALDAFDGAGAVVDGAAVVLVEFVDTGGLV